MSVPGRGLGRDQGGRRHRGQSPRPGGEHQTARVCRAQHRASPRWCWLQSWPESDHVSSLRRSLQHRVSPGTSPGSLLVSSVRQDIQYSNLFFSDNCSNKLWLSNIDVLKHDDISGERSVCVDQLIDDKTKKVEIILSSYHSAIEFRYNLMCVLLTRKWANNMLLSTLQVSCRVTL